MDTAVVENLIESLAFDRFRELARHCAEQLGYQKVTTSDGWSDGGRDLRVYRYGENNPLNVAIQSSVEWNWKSKLLKDCKTANEKLGCHTFVYITNRRLADAVFRPLVLQAQKELGVHLSKLDKQDLAQHIEDFDDMWWFAEFMGLTDIKKPIDGVSIRREVCEAFVLFSGDAQNFRASMAEHSLVITAIHHNGLTKDELIRKAKEAIGLTNGPQNLFASAIDRLTQRGEIFVKKPHGLYFATAECKKRQEASTLLVRKEYDNFVAELEVLLKTYLPKTVDSRKATEEVAKNTGNIIISYREYQTALLQPKKIDSDIRHKYVKELSYMRTLLHQEGVATERIDECLEKISGLNSKHSVLARLTAGEVFRKLFPVGEGPLLNALGRSKSIEIYFEPSVMVPFLCSMHYELSEQTLIENGRSLYDKSSLLGFPVLLPDLYLMECAFHLIRAGDYIPVVQASSPEELRYSDNAFVAFYAFKKLYSEIPFDQFLRSFGFGNIGIEDRRHVEMVKVNLTRILKGYRFEIFDTVEHTRDPVVRRGAETDLTHIYNERGIRKPTILQHHDIQIVQAMREKSQTSDKAQILVTWDKALQIACQQDEYPWWCLDPTSATDLLSLVSPKSPSTMKVDVALSIDVEHQKRASRIWDTVLRLEHGHIHNAELFTKALAFKEEFLRKQSGDSFRSEQIASSWKVFKEGASPRNTADAIAED